MMSSQYDVFFTVNEYDSCGEVVEQGVFLHFGNTRIKVAGDMDSYWDFVSQINMIGDEIQEKYRLK